MADTPAYVIAEVEVTDPAVFGDYAAKAGATLAAHKGRLLVGGKATAKEGAIPVGNIVMIEFPNLAAAEAWYASADYGPLIPLRQRSANSRLMIVEGRPQ